MSDQVYQTELLCTARELLESVAAASQPDDEVIILRRVAGTSTLTLTNVNDSGIVSRVLIATANSINNGHVHVVRDGDPYKKPTIN